MISNKGFRFNLTFAYTGQWPYTYKDHNIEEIFLE